MTMVTVLRKNSIIQTSLLVSDRNFRLELNIPPNLRTWKVAMYRWIYLVLDDLLWDHISCIPKHMILPRDTNVLVSQPTRT